MPNAGSVALHEAVGFTHIGTYPDVGFKFERWYDVGWWALPLNDRNGPPAPIVPLKDLGDLGKLLR